MKPADKDEWRRRYLRILTSRAKDIGDSQEDLQAIEDLVDEKLIRAWTRPDAQGIVSGAAVVDDADGFVVPTLKGRLFIEEQRAVLRSKTLLGRLKASWPLFSGLAGIVIGWILGLLSPMLQHRLYPESLPRLGQTPVMATSPSSSPTPKP
jgi:hypothetical protein